MNSNFLELNYNELSQVDGGFAVSLGFTIAVCAEVFAFTAAEVFLYNQNKKLK